MNVKNIIINYLKDNGYDGLVQTDDGCGCGIDEPFLCDNICEDCEPAYFRICSKCLVENCEMRGELGDGGDCYHREKL